MLFYIVRLRRRIRISNMPRNTNHGWRDARLLCVLQCFRLLLNVWFLILHLIFFMSIRSGRQRIQSHNKLSQMILTVINRRVWRLRIYHLMIVPTLAILIFMLIIPHKSKSKNAFRQTRMNTVSKVNWQWSSKWSN